MTPKGIPYDRDAAELRRKAVAALMQAGATLKETARLLDVDMRTVSRDRERLGLSRPPHTAWTEAEDSRALQLLADGCSLRDVSNTLGRPYHGVCHRFTGMGWNDQQTGQYNRLLAFQRRVLGD